MFNGAKERIGKLFVKKLIVQSAETLGGSPITPTDPGGVVAITGTGTVTTVLNTITSVQATLKDNPSIAAFLVSATWSGQTITLNVWKPTSSSNPTPIAATAAANVQWSAFGS